MESCAELLDRDQIRLLTDLGDESGAIFLAKLYEVFSGDARATLGQMRDLARCGDRAQLVRVAHRLKGSSSSIGATGFSRGCLEIERRARLQETAELDGPIDEALRLLDATLIALRAEA